MMDRFNQGMNFWRNAIDLRSQRHQILASNIANADTPYYKARDFDFVGAMEKAMGKRTDGSGVLALSTTSREHQEGVGKGMANDLLFHNEFQSSVDSNTVEMDVERTKIADNAIQYQILTQFISDEFRGMREALAPPQ